MKYEESYIDKRKISVLVYPNGLIQIEQIEPIPRIDYIEIDKSGDFIITSENEWNKEIVIDKNDRMHTWSNNIFKQITLIKKIDIKIYMNGEIRIEQWDPFPKADYVEISSSGEIKIVPEKDHNSGIVTGKLGPEMKP